MAGALFLVRWNDLVIAIPVFAVESVRMLRGAKSGRFTLWLPLEAAAPDQIRS